MVLAPRVRQTLSIAVLAVVIVLSLGFTLVHPDPAQAAVSDNLNFQARLEKANGAIAPDGDYNIRFKLYNASSAGDMLWTESYLNSSDQGVQVINGYISVNLGSITGFPTDMSWDQSLYATMEIGGIDETPDWDGEMNPRLKLTAVPYAFQAKSATQLQASDSGNTSTLSFAAPTTDNSIILPDASGTVCLQSSTSCGFAASSGSSSYLWNGTSQQTANFNVRSASSGSIAALIQGASGQSVDVFQAITDGGVGLKVASDGDVSADLLAVGTGAVAANGLLTVGTDTTAASGGMYFGTDTNLYRAGPDTLKTDDKFAVGTLGTDGASVLCMNASNEVAACGSGAGSGSFVFNGTTAQTGNLNLQSSSAASVTATFQGAVSQSANILEVKDAAGTPNTLLSISATGSATFKAAADADSIFSVKSPNNTTLLSIGTQNSGANLITNPSFEQGTDGWTTASLGGTFSQTTAQAYSGTGSAQLMTTSSSHGFKQTFGLTASTYYSLSFYVKADANTTITYGFYRNNFGFNPIACESGAAVTTSWTRKTCTFATYATMNADKGIFIRANDSPAHTFYVDAVQLELGSTVSDYSEGTISFGGSIVSSTTFRNTANSTSSFAVQNAEGVTLLGVDTTNRRLYSTVADGASAVGFALNTGNMTTSGAKLLSVMNNGSERFSIDKDGNAVISGTGTFSGSGNGTSTYGALFKNGTNSATAFQVQNAAGTSIFNVNTTNGSITMGAAGVFSYISGSLNVTTGVITGYARIGTSYQVSRTAGSAIGINDVLVYDSSGDVTQTTTARDPRVVGVAAGTVSSGQSASVVIEGEATVKVDTAAVAVGDQLVTSTVSGRATVDNSATTGIIGIALASKAGGSNGTVNAMIRPVSGQYAPRFQDASDSVTAFQVQNAAGTSDVFNVDTVNNRVGIGTDAPSYSLDVQGGDINTSGSIRTGGSTRINAAGNATLSGLTVPTIGTLDASTASGISMLAGSSNLNGGTGAAISILGGNQTGTTSIGGSVNVDAGTGTGTNGSVNIGTSNAATINIGNTGSTTVVNFAAGSNGMALSEDALTLAATAAATGRTINIAQAASGNDGDTLTIQAGQGSVTGDRDGGNVLLQAGAGGGSGDSGAVVVKAVDTANTGSFQIQNTVAGALFSADTSSNMRIVIGSGTPTLASSGLGDLFITGSLEVGKAVLIGTTANGAFFDGTTFELTFTGTARHARTITLSPTYAGSAVRGDGSNNTGTMSASFCSGSSLLNIPSSGNPCGAADQRNYYEWAADATNDNDIWTTYRLPTDFSAFNTTAFTFTGWGTTSDELATLTVYSGNTSCGTFTLTGNGSWQSDNITAATMTTNCPGLTAGSVLTLDVKLTVGSNGNHARAGEILINYLSKY